MFSIKPSRRSIFTKFSARLSRYAAEATAEHVGRSARKMGLKSVVMKVKGSNRE